MPFDVLTAVIVAILAAAATALVYRAIARSEAAMVRADLSVQLAEARRDVEWLQAEVHRQTETLGSTRALLDTADARLREAFQSLAATALKDSQASFLALAKTSFEQYQQPIADTLKNVDRRLGEAERERVAAYSRLSEQVMALGAAANTLSRALRTPAVRGRWGEMQLRRVVEMAGMLERCDFREQADLFTDTGRLRPDLIVQLPGGKQIVVDAKTPLDAFLDAQEATDEAVRTAKLQAHARQVRDHMDRLGSKAYAEQVGASTDMVVMFLPGETLFSAALQHDLTLIEHGLEQRVLLASPITLIALLTTVAHSWRQEALTDNYREVARLGREFYERLAIFADRFDDVRKRLDGAVQAYNEAAGSFEARVLVSARRLKDLDVTGAGELPSPGAIDAVPRVLRQVGLMGVPEESTARESE